MAVAKQVVPAVLAGLIALCLVGVFVGPHYGALEPAAETSTDDQDSMTEAFDYLEPDDVEVEPPPIITENIPVAPLVTPEVLAPPVLTDKAMVVSDEAQMQMLHRPVALAAGRFETNGRIIDLHSIEILPVDKICQAPNGENWPCGVHARTAFRGWLRARAIMCRLPEDDSGAITTSCTLGGEDVALWLVKNGWAVAQTDGAYDAAGRVAADTHRGIFGPKPITTMPEPTVFIPDIPAASGEPIAPAPKTPSGYFPPAPTQ